MPFKYYHPCIPARVVKTFPVKFNQMHISEIYARAKLLRNLKYSSKQAIYRIKERIKWEFELQNTPEFAEKIEGIVNEVYAIGRQ